jgi:DNA transposition AAA+ family ATPase
MSKEETISQIEFIVTKEYRRFAEFCDSCLRYRYIGLCYGLPGVGKTLSARYYTQWELLEPLLASRRDVPSPPVEVIGCHTILYTPAVANTPKRIEEEVRALRIGLSYLIEDAEHVQRGEDDWTFSISPPERMDLLVVDEADRLKVAGLEQMRDIYDRSRVGLVLIGMPGLEKRLARYPQLYSRVGFVHEFHPLSPEEARFILQQRWQQWGLALQADDFTDMEVVTAILRITEGNFRLIHRLLSQVERILQINELRTVTKEVIEVAREQLVIGLR